jgi:hypothetical protein
MKHLFTFLLVAISATSFAQGNLQFNQVLTFEGVGNSTWYRPPVNTVWKIERAFLNSDCSGSALQVNGKKASSAGNNSTTFPIWINDQDSIRAILGCSPQTYFISIIEFSVIP